MRHILLALLMTMGSEIGLGQTSSSVATIVNPRGFWGPENKITNPDGEQNTTGWTASGGTLTRTTTASQVYRGVGALSWDSSASSQTLSANTVSLVTAQLTSSQATFSCAIKAVSGTPTHKIQIYDGSAVLAEQTITPSTTEWRREYVTAPVGSSGTVRGRIISVASNEPQIFIDDCYFGKADGFNLFKQADSSFYGSLQYTTAASCTWTRNATSYADFAADTDCSTPTVAGAITALSTKVPHAEAANMPPGRYFVTVTYTQGEGTANARNSCRLVDDGGTQYDERAARFDGSANELYPSTLIGSFELSATATKTFKIQCKSDSGTARIHAETSTGYGGAVSFLFFKFPTSTQQVLRPDNIANSWSGYHDSTCTWSTTSSSYVTPSADASCGFTERTNSNFGTVVSTGSKTPGITFTPSRVGKYYVCAIAKGGNNSTGASTFQLLDGASTVVSEMSVFSISGPDVPIPLCGIYSAVSTSAVSLSIQLKTSSSTAQINANATGTAIEWSIFQIDQKFPAPIFSGSLVSDSQGVEKICRFSIASSCASSPCTISSQSGCVSSVVRNGTGDYTATFVASSFSSTPTCTITTNQAQVGISAISSSAVSYASSNSGGTASDAANTNVICMGPK